MLRNELENHLLKVLNFSRFEGSPSIEQDTAIDQILSVNGIYPEILIDVLESAIGKSIDQGLIQPDESVRMMCGRIAG